MSDSWKLSQKILLWFLIVLSLTSRTIQQQHLHDDDPPSDDKELWRNGDLQEIQDFLNCEENMVLPIHTPEIWKLLQSTYESILQQKSSLPKGGFLGLDGFYVSYTIDYGPHGRGIFAAQSIPEGTLVWRSIQTARFDTGDQYRQYLQQLPSALACDVLSWAYTRWEQERIVACVDLDSGSFVNGCDMEEECNLDVTSSEDSGCDLEFYSNRDIAMGEELRIDYSFSERAPGWLVLGMWRTLPYPNDEL